MILTHTHTHSYEKISQTCKSCIYIFKIKIFVNAEDPGCADYKAKFFKASERPLCTWSGWTVIFLCTASVENQFNNFKTNI